MSRLAVAMLGWSTLALAMCGLGCGKSAPPPPAPITMDSPRATADQLLRAFRERSAQIALALLPPDDLLKKSFDCPNDELVSAVKARRDRAPKDFGEVPKDMTIEIGTFDKSGSGDSQLRAGDPFQGCKAKGLINVHTSKVDLRLTKDGKTEFDSETWTFLKFGDDAKWYYFR